MLINDSFCTWYCNLLVSNTRMYPIEFPVMLLGTMKKLLNIMYKQSTDIRIVRYID